MQSHTNISTLKVWAKKHPILTGLITLFVIIFLINTFSHKEEPKIVPMSTSTTDPLSTLIDNASSTKISYKGTEDEKSTSDRPKNSHTLTIKYTVSSFYNKDSFMKDTGVLSGKVYQQVFSVNPNVSDVIVWYYGSMKDKYGNNTDKVLLSESIDRETYTKINWQNFDSKDICTFLKSETDTDERVVCAQRVNIE